MFEIFSILHMDLLVTQLSTSLAQFVFATPCSVQHIQICGADHKIRIRKDIGHLEIPKTLNTAQYKLFRSIFNIVG